MPQASTAERQPEREPSTVVRQPPRRIAQQSDALGRCDKPHAAEHHVERAEQDFGRSQTPQLTETGNSSNRKDGHHRNAGRDCEFCEEPRGNIAVGSKPGDGSNRAAGKEFELQQANGCGNAPRGRPTEREPRNRSNARFPQKRERRKHHGCPRSIAQERGGATFSRQQGEARHVLHQEEWQRDPKDGEHVPTDPAVWRPQ